MRRGKKKAGMTEGALSRRDFLRRSGHAGLGALAVTLGGAMSLHGQPRTAYTKPHVVEEPDREFVLEASEFDWELAPGLVVKAMGYNGQTPGPAIRCKEGERIRVYVENRIPDQAISVHWHGLDEISPMLMEGEVQNTVQAIPDVPFSSEGEYIYEFDAEPSGTRFIHPSHIWPGVVQMDTGLYAALIIEPKGPEPFPYDREYTLFFDDWATGRRPPLPGTWDGTAVGGVGGGMAMGMGTMMGAMMRGPRTMPYDITTINSKAYPLTKPLRVRLGERVRLRLINPSNWLTHVIRLTGHPLKVTHTDGNPLIEPVEVDALPITISERYDVFFEANRPGVWFLYCTQPGHAAAGEQVLVVYDGHTVSTPPPRPTSARLA